MAHSSLSNFAYTAGAVTEPRYAKADVAGAQTNSSLIAAAGAGKKIVVLGLIMSGVSASSITFKSSTTAISAVMTLGVNTPIVIYNPAGLFVTSANEALQCDTGVAGVGVQITYVVVG